MKEHCKGCEHWKKEEHQEPYCVIMALRWDTNGGISGEHERCPDFVEKREHTWRVMDKLNGEGEVI